MTTTRPTARAERQPEYFSPRPNLTQGSEPVEATVKWFNADKGFGFVIVAGGADAFLLARALEMAGHSTVPDGARLKVRISQGQKGPQVAEVLEVDTSTAHVMSKAGRPSPRPSSPRSGAGATVECLGSIKWYNVEKGSVSLRKIAVARTSSFMPRPSIEAD
jgi:CspA family cold shock protein